MPSTPAPSPPGGKAEAADSEAAVETEPADSGVEAEAPADRAVEPTEPAEGVVEAAAVKAAAVETPAVETPAVAASMHGIRIGAGQQQPGRARQRGNMRHRPHDRDIPLLSQDHGTTTPRSRFCRSIAKSLMAASNAARDGCAPRRRGAGKDRQKLQKPGGEGRRTGHRRGATPPAGFTARPIGTIETPFRTIAECPRNGRLLDPAPLCRARVLPEYAAGLQDLEGFSHLILLYWFDRAEAPTLVFRPPFDPAERGVFATRTPHRPNPIGLAVVAFEGFEAPGVLKVRYLDCLDGTPLLDIKPYLPTTDAEPAASMGWLGR